MKDVNSVSAGYYNPEICNLVDFLEIINQTLVEESVLTQVKWKKISQFMISQHYKTLLRMIN